MLKACSFDEFDAQALIALEGEPMPSESLFRLLSDDQRKDPEVLWEYVAVALAERVAYERRYAEVQPRWNRIPKARREYLEELCERHRDEDGVMARLLRGD